MGAMANNSTAAYVDWEEVIVSGDKGQREVHYYLKRGSGGGKDLVVVGKEKSVRHMRYHYVIKDNKLLISILNGSSRLKLRSRREVIDWLNSILSGERSKVSCRQFGGGVKRNSDDDIVEDVTRQKLGQFRAEFTWLGSSWMCRKRRMHYQSFCRNGAVISAHDFVYVLAEEGNRLVAYLDDMYEDTRGNKMVVVRWFHKIDEVGFVLPHNYNDREIFFSLCLQDLNIECIDGLATVLTPEHYEKLSREATRMGLAPFVCSKLFDNDDVKPYDITQIKGYWNQEILKNKSSIHGLSKSKEYISEAVGFRSNKRIRWSEGPDLSLKSPVKGDSETSLQFSGGMKQVGPKEGCSVESVSDQENSAVGSQVEVLSQDSGIRGCWFRASIIKKHKKLVKIQYRDLKDAVDDSKNLEEWILASRLAAPDALSVRFSGRTIVRPNPPSDKVIMVNVGSVVDAWWHDGWWEGIVVRKQSEDKFTVYFPDEKREQIFCSDDLRHSKDWIDNGWKDIKQRPDVVSSIYGTKTDSSPSTDDRDIPAKILKNSPLPEKANNIRESMVENADKMPQFVRDLSKDCLLAQLRWKSSGKRRRERSPVHKRQCGNISLRTFEKMFADSDPMKLDSDNCKYDSHSHFGSSVVPPVTNLVMSR